MKACTYSNNPDGMPTVQYSDATESCVRKTALIRQTVVKVLARDECRVYREGVEIPSVPDMVERSSGLVESITLIECVRTLFDTYVVAPNDLVQVTILSNRKIKFTIYQNKREKRTRSEPSTIHVKTKKRCYD